MNIHTNLWGYTSVTTIEKLVDEMTILNLYDYTIKDQNQRDYFEAYCLVLGVDFELKDWISPIHNAGHVHLTIPDLPS